MSYDAWKTRTPEDDAMRGVGLRPASPAIVWRTCQAHGWTQHQQWGVDRPVCLECRAEETAVNVKRFDELMAFVLGPRPDDDEPADEAPEPERHRDEDDGRTYADPRDEREDRLRD